MDRYVAFLRGMNLGNRRIKNAELRAEFEELGFEEVATFRASGNVIFGVGEKASAAKLTERDRSRSGGGARLRGAGLPAQLAEVAAIAAQEPFPAKAVAASKGKLQVHDAGEEAERRGRASRRSPWRPTRTAWRSRAASSTGCRAAASAESELDLKAIEKALGPGTMRTMGTIEQIAAKHCSGLSSRTLGGIVDARQRGDLDVAADRADLSGSSASWTLATNSSCWPSGRKKLS